MTSCSISRSHDTNRNDVIKRKDVNLAAVAWFNIEIGSGQFKQSHFEDKAGYTDEIASLYWNDPLGPFY